MVIVIPNGHHLEDKHKLAFCMQILLTGVSISTMIVL